MGSYGNRTIMGIKNTAQDENAPVGVAKNPGLTPYATNVGSAVINPNEIDEWKGDQVTTVKNHFKEQLNELKEAKTGECEQLKEGYSHMTKSELSDFYNFRIKH